MISGVCGSIIYGCVVILLRGSSSDGGSHHFSSLFSFHLALVAVIDANNSIISYLTAFYTRFYNTTFHFYPVCSQFALIIPTFLYDSFTYWCKTSELKTRFRAHFSRTDWSLIRSNRLPLFLCPEKRWSVTKL